MYYFYHINKNIKYMKRTYHNFLTWEDYKAGMYNTDFEKSKEREYIDNGKTLLSNSNLFLSTALEMVSNWTVSAKENLTNIQCNRQSWIGQASCCYLYGSPEILTRISWAELTDEQRIEANRIADIVINQFEINHENKNRKLHF